jgi:hypothetical protein
MGSENYREREDAQAELAKMGRLAKIAIAEAVRSETDPEIRSRATRLLPKVTLDDLKARVETFLADKDGKFEHDLPGLKLFRKHVGATEKGRALYVEILKSPYNLDMFAEMEKGNEAGGRAISDRRNTMWSEMQFRQFPGGGKPAMQPKQPSLADIAAVLLAESEVPAENIPKSTINWQQVSGVLFFNQGTAMQAINGNGGTHSEAFTAIARRWLATRTDPQELAQLVYQLGNGNLRQFPETKVLLRRIVTTDAVQGYAKGQALNYIVQQGGKEETAFLKTLLKDDSQITQVWFGKPNGMAEMHNCMMKDVALAYLLTQSGQAMRDYGFETQQGGFVPQPASFGQYAFTTEEKRNAAFVKYGFWQMKQALKDPNSKDTPPPQGTDPKPQPNPPGGIKPGIRPLPAPVPPVALPAQPPVALPLVPAVEK